MFGNEKWRWRLAIAAAAAWIASGAILAGQPAPVPLIVFVCEHGSAKSLLAASFLDRLAKEQGLAMRAVSRGTSPDASVPPAVVEWLHGDGFDVASFQPQALSATDVATATRIVTIGVDIGSLADKAGPRLEKWNDIPPVSESYSKARAALVARIRSLIREASTGKK